MLRTKAVAAFGIAVVALLMLSGCNQERPDSPATVAKSSKLLGGTQIRKSITGKALHRSDVNSTFSLYFEFINPSVFIATQFRDYRMKDLIRSSRAYWWVEDDRFCYYFVSWHNQQKFCEQVFAEAGGLRFVRKDGRSSFGWFVIG